VLFVEVKVPPKPLLVRETDHHCMRGIASFLA
jgi:hypothetical protein